MTDFEILERIEANIVDLCSFITESIRGADAHTIDDFLCSVGELGYMIQEFAATTTEWNCFESCLEHDNRLRTLFVELESRFCE